MTMQYIGLILILLLNLPLVVGSLLLSRNALTITFAGLLSAGLVSLYSYEELLFGELFVVCEVYLATVAGLCILLPSRSTSMRLSSQFDLRRMLLATAAYAICLAFVASRLDITKLGIGTAWGFAGVVAVRFLYGYPVGLIAWISTSLATIGLCFVWNSDIPFYAALMCLTSYPLNGLVGLISTLWQSYTKQLQLAADSIREPANVSST